MYLKSKILITGARGLLGTAIVNELKKQGYQEIYTPTSQELNLLDDNACNDWFNHYKPEYIFHLASLVYGLKGNLENQLQSIHQNTQMNLNLFNACGNHGVQKIFFAGTVASYPYPYPSLPLKEEFFMEGEPHDGEYGYAIAKRHALSYLKILKRTKNIDYCYGIFTNLYGINDKFDIDGGHVIPSLIKKSIDAMKAGHKVLNVWGNKETKRDFLNSKDAANAALLCMQKIDGMVNISSGISISMGEIVGYIQNYFNNNLTIEWDSNAPIGIAERSVSNEKLLSYGFKSEQSIEKSITETIQWAELFYENLRY
ncbi:MAG: NAD-dependent epimerase/dehydratase family protein [Erysipelotrichia bacterium]|nr:NAD-dependent epimerase/dehydratase family protein [Erysipelotrichia bacterium]